MPGAPRRYAQTVKLIYTDQNRILVEHARNLLEGEGIAVGYRNEYVAGAAGEMAPTAAWLELWVLDDEDIDRARIILGHADEDASGPDRTCQACGETSPPAFGVCWNCGATITT